MIAPLYGIEKVARESGRSPEARKDLRQQHAPAILDLLYRRLLELNPARVGSPVLPKSPLGKAIRYMLSQWESLVRYLEDGRYEIDTNLVENAIRPSCVGKKNWLFIVSVRWSTWFPIRCKSGDSEGCMTSKVLAGAATNPRSINSFVSSGTPGSTSGSSPKRLASTH
jgi:hypothetical protein